MKELALHILDLIQNSIRAKANTVELMIHESISENGLSITIKDNGVGMSKDMVQKVSNPFITTRTTRKVGLGIPFMAQMCEECNGRLDVKSIEGKGTTITAYFQYDHIDRLPLGNVGETIAVLILAKPDIRYVYIHRYEEKEFIFDTEVIQQTLGGVPIQELEIINWLKYYIQEQLQRLKE